MPCTHENAASVASSDFSGIDVFSDVSSDKPVRPSHRQRWRQKRPWSVSSITFATCRDGGGNGVGLGAEQAAVNNAVMRRRILPVDDCRGCSSSLAHLGRKSVANAVTA